MQLMRLIMVLDLSRLLVLDMAGMFGQLVRPVVSWCTCEGLGLAQRKVSYARLDVTVDLCEVRTCV